MSTLHIIALTERVCLCFFNLCVSLLLIAMPIIASTGTNLGFAIELLLVLFFVGVHSG